MSDYSMTFGAKGSSSFRVRGLLIALAFLICLSGNARAGFVYTLNDGGSGLANRIYGYSVDETTGALTAIAGSPFVTGGNGAGQTSSEMLTIDRINNRLYAINDGSDTVSAYSINAATGILTVLPFSPIVLPAGGIYQTIAVRPSGSPLIVSDNTGSKSASYVITATTATAAAGSPFSTGIAVPYSSVFSRNGNYFYTGGNGGNVFAGFSVNAGTGVLTVLAGSPFAAGNSPFGYATDAQGRLFLANEVAGQVRAFTTAVGVPTPAASSPFNSGLTAVHDGVLSPNGNFYVVADRIGNQVGSFQITGTGAATTLSAVAGSPSSSNGTNTDSLVFNNTGTFLFAANASSRNISTYNFNQTTGAPTFNNRQPANTTGTTGNLTGIDYLVPSLTTAATVTISGRATTAAGRGIKNVLIRLTDAIGRVRYAYTTTFGYYSFSDVNSGETIFVTAKGKRYEFAEPTQVLNVNEAKSNLNFIAY